MIETFKYHLSINGERVSTAETLEVINPATAKVFALAPSCSPEQLDQAVEAARTAFPAWRGLLWDDRRDYLRRMSESLAAHIDDLAPLLTCEQGKPLPDSKWELGITAAWPIEVNKLQLADIVNIDSDEQHSVTVHEPLGVVAAITPWNVPVALSMAKIAYALLAGNTVVLKPSPLTPLTMLKVGELFNDILPPGVLNVICGPDSLGPQLSRHADVDKISFTGSTNTGRHVMADAASSLKRLTLELGGNDPAIVLEDADIESAAEALCRAAFLNAGQVCMAPKRIYVDQRVHAAFRDAFVAQAAQLVVGDGAVPGTHIGPVQNAKQAAHVQSIIDDLRSRQSDIIEASPAPDLTGYFFPIMIADAPPKDSRLVREEQFGPITPILPFSDLEEAIHDANDTDYGLAASVWSGNADRAAEVAARLCAGTVWINQVQIVDPLIVFAGRKASGFGGEYGVEGLREFTAPKVISARRARAGAV